MKIKLVTGASIFDATINTLKQIDLQNHEMENLVVVPDSFSLQAENLLFKTLNIKSTFNIEVVGISRLASKILKSNNIGYKRISSLEEIFNIYKAVKICEDEFQYFNKCGVDFCIKILQIIKQFKACKISISQFKPIGDENLDKKIHDLKIIYEKYEELLGEQFDLSKLLEFFLEKAENTLNLSKINLFFVNFDSFTLEINSFICKLAKFVNCVYISMARATSPRNSFVFENDIFEKTTKLAKNFDLTVETLNFPTNLDYHKKLLSENLFSFDVQSAQDDYFLNVVAKNRKDEVEFVAKYIKYNLVKGARFKNFAIAVSDKKYFNLINSVFAQYEITYYLDDAVNLSETILGKFLTKIFEISKLGFSKSQFEYLASSLLISPNEEVVKDVQFLMIDNKEDFLSKFPQYKDIVSLILQLSNCKISKDYSSILKAILNLIKTNYENLLKNLEEDRNFKKQSENSQAFDLILKVLDKLEELGKNEEFSLFDYENLLNLSFKSIKVETIPTYIDAVFVGDATDSYFEDVDNLFVLGATSSALPRQQKDVGIIDDEDIKKLKVRVNLEPEIRVINRRNRIKIFEMLMHANKKLIVLMPSVEDGRQSQRANFVDDLIKLFGKNVLHTSALEEFNLPIDSKDKEFERLLFLVGCKTNLNNAYSKLKDSLPIEFSESLRDAIETKLPKIENYEYFDCEKLKKTSVSQLECYFSCPFKYYLQYILKIKPSENSLPNKRLYGIFQHDLLRKFLENNKNIQAINEKEINEFLKENVENIARTIYHENAFKNPSFLKYLFNEAKILLKNVVKEQKLSSFKPILLEEKISERLGDTLFVGFVDRVDKSGNYFRIFDYKTGKTKNLLKELHYGQKLQLFLYAMNLKKRLNLECAGVYYFDCQSKFSKNEKTKLLNGITLKNNDVVLMTDYTLDEGGRSELLGMRRKTSSKENEFAFKYGNTEENFDKLFEYARKISLKAIKYIEEGYFPIKPFKESCVYCQYNSICRHKEGFRKF